MMRFAKVSVIIPRLILILLMFSWGSAIDKTLDMAQSGMLYSEKGSEITMENVVNVKTPGFKEVKQRSVYDAKSSQVINIVSNSFIKGPFVSTGRPLDFAIEGNGFFMVLEAATGKILLTSDGRFEVNENRELITTSKRFKVLDVNRSVIEIPPYVTIRADEKGRLYDNNNSIIAALGIADTDDHKKLSSLNNVFFYVKDGNRDSIQLVESATLKQGYYEGSNIDYSKTIAKMASSGKYGANVNLVQTRMKMLDTIIDIANKQ